MSKREKLLGFGLGAGLVGAVFVALKYAVRPPSKARVPDTISPAVFATKVLHTSHGQIVYHESGQGQPLVFVHGIGPGASSYEWSKVYPTFATGCQVLAPDLIGFGESARPRTPMGASEHIRALLEFIRATCEQPPILIGSGLGAGFCTYLASQHPEWVHRLILLMPTGLNDFGRGRLPRGTKLASRIPLLNRFLYRNYQSTRSSVRSWLLRDGFANPGLLSDEIVDVYTTCAQQYGAEHSFINFQAGRLSFDLENRIKTISHPISLIWADKVVFPPLEWAYRFQELSRASSLSIIENAGALAALEQPSKMIEILLSQLDDNLRVFKTS